MHVEHIYVQQCVICTHLAFLNHLKLSCYKAICFSRRLEGDGNLAIHSATAYLITPVNCTALLHSRGKEHTNKPRLAFQLATVSYDANLHTVDANYTMNTYVVHVKGMLMGLSALTMHWPKPVRICTSLIGYPQRQLNCNTICPELEVHTVIYMHSPCESEHTLSSSIASHSMTMQALLLCQIMSQKSLMVLASGP